MEALLICPALVGGAIITFLAGKALLHLLIHAIERNGSAPHEAQQDQAL